MNAKLKGYLLTYVGWILGTTLAVAAAYGLAGDQFQQIVGEQFDGIEGLLLNGLAAVIAIIYGLVVYQVVTLIASPLITYLLLMHTHDKVVSTVAFQFGLLFISPLFIGLSILFNSSATLAIYLTVIWLLLTPFLARYIALKPITSKKKT